MMESVRLTQILLEDFCTETYDLWKFVGSLIKIMKWIVPVILVLMGTIDFAKAVVANEYKLMNDATRVFIKRLIYGVATFLIITLVRSAFGLLAENVTGKSNKCWEALESNAGGRPGVSNTHTPGNRISGHTE